MSPGQEVTGKTVGEPAASETVDARGSVTGLTAATEIAAVQGTAIKEPGTVNAPEATEIAAVQGTAIKEPGTVNAPEIITGESATKAAADMMNATAQIVNVPMAEDAPLPGTTTKETDGGIRGQGAEKTRGVQETETTGPVRGGIVTPTPALERRTSPNEAFDVKEQKESLEYFFNQIFIWLSFLEQPFAFPSRAETERSV